MTEIYQHIIHKMGGIVTSGDDGADNNYGLTAPGQIIDEPGTVRMGDLFVVDGGPLISQVDKNPTWKSFALFHAGVGDMVDELKKDNI